jgi:hypothetical protein
VITNINTIYGVPIVLFRPQNLRSRLFRRTPLVFPHTNSVSDLSGIYLPFFLMARNDKRYLSRGLTETGP